MEAEKSLSASVESQAASQSSCVQVASEHEAPMKGLWGGKIVGRLPDGDGWSVEGLYPTPHIYEQMTAQIMATSLTCLSTTR